MFQPKYKWYESYTTFTASLILIGSVALFWMFAGAYGAFGMQAPFEQFAFLNRLSTLTYLPLVIIGLPALGGGIQLFFSRKTCYSRDTVVIGLSFLTVLLTAALYPSALEGGTLLSLPGLLGLGLSFRVDMLGFMMLLITSVLWFLVMVYATPIC